MKCSINRWAMALATAGVLALPVPSFAKAVQEQQSPQQQQPQQQPQPQPAQPQPAQPQPQPEQPQPQPAQPQPAQPQPAQPQPNPQPQQPTQPQPTEPQTPQPPTTAAAPSADQPVSPQEHLRQAQQAVNAIPATSVPAKNRTELAQLKRHLSNLEKVGSSPGASAAEPSRPGASKSESATKINWGTEVAAIDKIISDMIGSDTSSPSASTPGATGTSGASRPNATSSTAIDDATRTKLMEVRTHITAYAAGMAGAPSTPKSEETAGAAAATAATAATPPAATPPAATPPAATASPSPTSPAPAATPSPENPAAGAQTPPSTKPDANAAAPQAPAAGQQPPAAGQQPPTAGQPSTDAQQPQSSDEAHRHLVAARDTLSQLTQLPAAAQLSGEARTQVSQLITNFNELIGNPPDWRVSYQKVAANLTTLLGPDNSGAEAQGAAPTAAPGATATPGAVGTAGTATIELDPNIRAKLVEFRRSVTQFEKAAAGAK